MILPTRYFLAGGRARSPLSNVDAYFSFEEIRFLTFSVDISII